MSLHYFLPTKDITMLKISNSLVAHCFIIRVLLLQHLYPPYSISGWYICISGTLLSFFTFIYLSEIKCILRKHSQGKKSIGNILLHRRLVILTVKAKTSLWVLYVLTHATEFFFIKHEAYGKNNPQDKTSHSLPPAFIHSHCIIQRTECFCIRLSWEMFPQPHSLTEYLFTLFIGTTVDKMGRQYSTACLHLYLFSRVKSCS